MRPHAADTVSGGAGYDALPGPIAEETVRDAIATSAYGGATLELARQAVSATADTRPLTSAKLGRRFNRPR